MTLDEALAGASAKLQAKGFTPGPLIEAIIAALQQLLGSLCPSPVPPVAHLTQVCAQGLADCKDGRLSAARFRLRTALRREGIRLIGGGLDRAELACWEIATETPPPEIGEYAAVWTKEGNQ